HRRAGRVENLRVLPREIGLELLPVRMTAGLGVAAELVAVERRKVVGRLVALLRVVVGRVLELLERIGVVFLWRLVVLLRAVPRGALAPRDATARARPWLLLVFAGLLGLVVRHALRLHLGRFLFDLLLRLDRRLRLLVGERRFDLLHVRELRLVVRRR